MWPSWVKTRAPRSTPCPSTELAAAAATPSLKDIPSLLNPEPAAAAHPPRVFHRLRVAVSAILLLRFLQPAQVADVGEEAQVASGGEDGGRLVLYFTSLQAIRRTFNDCKAVRAILRTLRAAVDERDLYKDKRFASELATLLPPHRPGAGVTLPQLFIGGRHLGGAEDVRRLYQSGELHRIVVAAAHDSDVPACSCGRCGGELYVLCGSCDGKHKLYNGGGHFRECADCNLNGLVRCPGCFSPAA